MCKNSERTGERANAGEAPGSNVGRREEARGTDRGAQGSDGQLGQAADPLRLTLAQPVAELRTILL